MTNPKQELRVYLHKLINHFVFIKRIVDDLETITIWTGKPGGIDGLEEGASFFNFFQRLSNQTLLIELFKFISEDEKKSLWDFLNMCKNYSHSLEPRALFTANPSKKNLTPEEFNEIIEEMFEKLNDHQEVIKKLKARRDKSLAHTDPSFFNNPKEHFEKYPIVFDELNKLLLTVENILEKLALHILEIHYDFKVNTITGLDRVIEFMRAYHKIMRDEPEKTKYRFDDEYRKKN